MRRSLVVGVLVGAAFLAGSPALAGPPEITQRSCEAQGGTFTRAEGVKSCTRVTQAEVPATYGQLPYLNLDGPLITTPTAFGYTENQLRGTSREIRLLRTTTVQTQKGAGPVTTTVRQATVSARIEQISCDMRTTDYDLDGDVLLSRYDPRPFADCAELGLFLRP